MNNKRLESLLEILAENQADAFVLFAIAKEYEAMGNENEALRYYLKLKDIQPDYVGLYYHLAALYVKLEQKDKALDIFETGIALSSRIGDHHAKAELLNARQNLEFE
jgi:tetratricopeptide (TPR) repeat protein